MKKKIITMILLVTMVCSMAACGRKEETSQNTEQEDTVTAENNVSEEEQEEEKQAEEKTSDEKWGVYYNWVVSNKDGKILSYGINYPSIVPPNETAFYTVTYQKDASLVVKVCGGSSNYPAQSIETMLEDCNELFCEGIWGYRKKDLDYDTSYQISFEVESTELTTINDFLMCKYVGNNVISNGEKTYTFPFVGYAADLKEGEGAYLMWMVIDDSEFRTTQEPLEEGTIEEYALKMAESLKLKE